MSDVNVDLGSSGPHHFPSALDLQAEQSLLKGAGNITSILNFLDPQAVQQAGILLEVPFEQLWGSEASVLRCVQSALTIAPKPVQKLLWKKLYLDINNMQPDNALKAALKESLIGGSLFIPQESYFDDSDATNADPVNVFREDLVGAMQVAQSLNESDCDVMIQERGIAEKSVGASGASRLGEGNSVLNVPKTCWFGQGRAGNSIFVEKGSEIPRSLLNSKKFNDHLVDLSEAKSFRLDTFNCCSS